MNKKNNKGFTLIEMLVVIAIIGILAVIVLFSVTNSLKKSRDSKRLTDINQVILNANLYYDKNGVYPTQLSDLNTGFLDPAKLVDPKDKTKTGTAYINYQPSLATNPTDCTVTIQGSEPFETVDAAQAVNPPYTQDCAQ